MAMDPPPSSSLAPHVEVEMVFEAGRPGLSGRDWCALQVWTKNRIYDVEWSMRCFCVTDRASAQPIPGHRLLNAKLSGGQRRGETALELTYPLPRPGVAAVFELPDKSDYVTTSEVTRVVLRLRVLSVSGESEDRSWKELSGSLEASPLGGTRPGFDGDAPR